MTLRYALYDLDNTLYPHSSGLMELINERIGLFVQQFLQLSPEEAQALRHHYYHTYGTTLGGLQRHHDVDQEQYLLFVHDIVLDALASDTNELKLALDRLPLYKVIFTNSPREHAERVLKRLDLLSHFDTIFDIRSVAFRGKPHDDAYFTVLQALGCHANECVLFEDTAVNLTTAKALGMMTVLITPDHEPHPDADIVAPDVLTATTAVHDMLGHAIV